MRTRLRDGTMYRYEPAYREYSNTLIPGERVRVITLPAGMPAPPFRHACAVSDSTRVDLVSVRMLHHEPRKRTRTR